MLDGIDIAYQESSEGPGPMTCRQPLTRRKVPHPARKGKIERHIFSFLEKIFY